MLGAKIPLKNEFFGVRAQNTKTKPPSVIYILNPRQILYQMIYKTFLVPFFKKKF